MEIISNEVVFKSVEVDKSIYPGFDHGTFQYGRLIGQRWPWFEQNA